MAPLLIGWNQDTQPEDILDNEISAKLIIIDEMSMVDTWLFHQFMNAVPIDAQIVLVGPGPTDGNWSSSPTSTIWASIGTAFINW